MTGRPTPGVGAPTSRAGRHPRVTRRRFLGTTGLAAVASLSGCSGGDDPGAEADVVAGPEGRLSFEPATTTVAAGETVTWFFDSPGHNVCGRPSDSETVELPPGAEPFATYGPDQSALRLVESGATYEHRFAVPGSYVYVCVPHESAGMVGRVEVEE